MGSLQLGEVYNSMPDEGFKILSVVEAGMGKYEYVPVTVILKQTRIPPKKLDLLLGFLASKGLLRRRIGYRVGYKLTFLGLDIVALHSLVRRGVLKAIGDKIGIGKESEIYEALAPGNTRVAVKFHKVGRTSFKRTLLLRPYVLERETPDWFSESKLSAQREYKAITELFKYTKYVPRPIAYSRNAVVIDFVEGVELYKVRHLSDPIRVLEGIKEVIEIAYCKVGIVHGDLSEYNIIIRFPDESPVIIDWPQYVYKDHPSAITLLRRDVYYVIRYFNKRFGLKVEPEDFFRKVISKGAG